MATNPCIPFFTQSDHVTGKATGAAVVGKRFVKYVAGGTVGLPAIAPAAVGDAPNAVAGRDAKDGEAVHIITAGHLPITAAVELAPGDLVKVGADGKADKATAGDPTFGVVYVGAAAGADAAIFLKL